MSMHSPSNDQSPIPCPYITPCWWYNSFENPMLDCASEIVPVAFDVFSIVAFVLLFPILFIYGTGSQPNIPVCAIAGWFLFFNLRNAISMIAWSGGDVETWWLGRVWCDFDIRMNAAGQTGIFLALIACLINLIRIFSLKAKLMDAKHGRRQMYLDLAICYTVPVILFAIYTPVTTVRYLVTQYLGCTASTDYSVVTLIFYLIWPPLFGTIAPALLLVLFWKVYKRGRSGTIEAISFTPQLSNVQFVRLTAIASIICLVLTPLSWCVAGVNFNNIANNGVTPVAWAHGKPDGWNEPVFVPYELFKNAQFQDMGQTFVYAWVMQLCELILSFFVFGFYGTGAVARSFYGRVLRAVKLETVARSIRLLPPQVPHDEESELWNEYSPNAISPATFMSCEKSSDIKGHIDAITTTRPVSESTLNNN